MIDYDSLIGSPVPEVDPEALKAEVQYRDDFIAKHGSDCVDGTREARPETMPVMQRAMILWGLRYLGSHADVTRAHGEDYPELAILEKIFAKGPTEKMFKAMAKVAMTYPDHEARGVPMDFEDLVRLYEAA
jgi:hypothetical protein